MSFFADMLAGGAVGLGTGMAAQYQSDQQERIRQEALDEKRALAMQLQQQRSEDLRYRVDQDRANKVDSLALYLAGDTRDEQLRNLYAVACKLRNAVDDIAAQQRMFEGER